MNTSYRDIIRRKLAERSGRNKSYSLRAFARDVGIEISQLSRVINGKQGLSSSSARLFAEKILDQESEREFFVHLVEFETSKNPAIRTLALKKLEKLQSSHAITHLQLESFRVISDWYHIAILDFVGLNGVETSIEFISRALGISQVQTKLAVDRLLNLGLLKTEKSRLVKTDARISLPSGPSSQSVREFHKQMIDLAKISIEEQSVDQRYLRGETVSIDRVLLPEFYELMEKFSQQIQVLAEKSKKTNALYQFNLQFFDLAPQFTKKPKTKKIKKERKSEYEKN